MHSVFLTMYQIIDLASPKVSAISLSDFWGYFQSDDALLHLHQHLSGMPYLQFH